MPAEFVHLHVHSQYSFLTSAVKLSSLADQVKKLGMPAVALTDQANMYGAVRHYNACRSAGIQPILGCELNVIRSSGSATDHLVLLAATKEGYKNLIRLVSDGHLASATQHVPSVTLDAIAARSRGLVVLTGCLGGVVPQRVLEFGPDQADVALGELKERFEPGHVFVELQDHGFPEQPVINRILTESARRLDLPLVATNDVHFTSRDDGVAQIYLECVRQGRTFEEAEPLHHGSFEMYLKTAEEMAQAFNAVPEAVANTLRVAEMCSGLELDLGKAMLPRFAVPEGYDTDGYLRHVSREGLADRLAEFVRVRKRIEEQR